MATRRGRGEGSITRRADGRWMARVDLGWQDGKRRRKTLYGRTKREVQDKLRETLHRTEKGLPPVPEQETVGAFLRRWLEIIRSQLRPRTHRSYEQVVRIHLEPGIGRVRLAKLTPLDVSTLLESRRAAGVGGRTIHYARAVLRAALNKALKWGLVSRNVASLTDPPRYRAREIAPLTPDQTRKFLAAVADHRLEALFTVAVGLGLRLGEGLGLPWDAVDLDAGTLSVRQTLERGGKQPRFGEPKSARGRRTIVLPGIVTTALRKHRTRQLQERLVAGERWNDSGLVFTTEAGAALDAAISTGRSRRSCAGPDFRPFGTTTCGTLRRRCYSRRASTCGPSWKRSGTRRSA